MPIQQTGSTATDLYLRSNAGAITARAQDLWDKYSGAPGLLNSTASAAGEISSDQRTGYIYDQATGEYYRADNGLPVTQKQLDKYVSNVSAESSMRMSKLTQQLIAGIILLDAWYMEMRSLMAALYETIWILSIGGYVFQDDIQRNLFYLFMLPQFGYLDNFYYQLEHELQPLNGFAMTRARQYGKAGNAIWQNIQWDQDLQAGKTQARRVLGPNEHHCNDSEDRPGCLELAALGWIAIQDMVPIGGATCYHECKCRIETR